MLPADALATYGLLTASIVALWFRPRPGTRGWSSYIWSLSINEVKGKLGIQ